MQENDLIEEYSSKDFLLNWESGHFVDIQNPYNREYNEYNQNKEPHLNSCTAFAFMWNVQINSWLNFTQDEVEIASLKAIEKWVIDPDRWAVYYKTANFIRKYIKKKYDLRLKQFRTETGSEPFRKGLKNWWAFCIWYRSSEEMFNDRAENWIVEWTNYPTPWWHLVYAFMENWQLTFINSYKWVLDYNKFYIENFEELVKNWVIMKYSYILLPTKDIMENKQLQKDIDDIELAKEKWLINSEQEVKDVKDWNYTQDVKTTLKVVRGKRIDL